MDADEQRDGRRRLRAGVVLPVRIDPAGRQGPTKWAAKQGIVWQRSSHGYYVPRATELSLDQRIVEASVRLPEHGGVTGWASLAWRRPRWFDARGVSWQRRPICLVTAGSDIRAVPGIAVSAERLVPRDLEWVDGVHMTTAIRSAWFEMRYVEDPRMAVVVMDMVAYEDLVSIDEMADWAWHHQGWTGAPQHRWALGYASENSWSPMETLTHLVWQIDAVLPPMLANRAVFDRRGRRIGTPDLIDVEAGLVVQYNGAVHLVGNAPARDAEAEAAYRAHGLVVVTVVATDLSDRAALAGRFHRERRNCSFAAESTRLWTVTPPPGWISTTSVARRRALDDAQRERVLRYRVA